MQIKHDYSIINRSKKEKDKVRSRKKTDIKVTDEYLENMKRIVEEEKQTDINDWVRSIKGNRLQKINKYLFDPAIMPKERICYKFKADKVRCKGKLRDHRVVEVNFIQANNKKPQYHVSIDGNELFAKAAQHEVIDELRILIGDK